MLGISLQLTKNSKYLLRNFKQNDITPYQLSDPIQSTKYKNEDTSKSPTEGLNGVLCIFSAIPNDPCMIIRNCITVHKQSNLQKGKRNNSQIVL